MNEATSVTIDEMKMHTYPPVNVVFPKWKLLRGILRIEN